MTGVIEHSAMRTDHPVFYFPTINVQWRSRFAVWKRSDHERRAQQDIPFIKELLPRDNGLVTPMNRLQIVCEGGRSFLLFRLEGSSHHSDQCAGAREFLVEIHLWQRRCFNSGTQGSKLLRQFFYCSANIRRDRKAWKGGSKGDPQMLEIEVGYFVNRHRRYFGIASIRPGDDRVQQRQILNRPCHRPNTGHDAHRSGPRKTRNQPGEWHSMFGWLHSLSGFLRKPLSSACLRQGLLF